MHKRIHTIGDPHLGKRFVNGVPLHRRGEREKMVRERFVDELLVPCDFNVCMGDLLDKMVVDIATVLFAADEYRHAAAVRPNTLFIVLRGNHDASRDADKRSSFDLFRELVRGVPNIVVVDDCASSIGDLLFFPWHPFKTAAEVVEQIPADEYRRFRNGQHPICFGHWDIKDFDGQNTNLVPVEQLKKLQPAQVITGHYHKAGVYDVDGLQVEVTGSLQPYAHGEETDESLYVTRKLEELGDDLSIYKDKCLRVLLKPGQSLPDVGIDCLQLTVKRVAEDGTIEPEDVSVELDPFDLRALFDEAMSSEQLPSEFTAEIWDKFKELQHA
jgi:DNA repair exonuclease SbcCD nuclease subunit